MSRVIEKHFSEKQNIFLSTVYMDTKRVDTPEYLEKFYHYYKERFKESSFDVIMVADNSALEFVKSHYEELFAHKPIFMLDEIQLVDGWEKFARRLADHKYLVYITGSNAKMLSKEISTTLGGRYIVQNVFPFSFMEFLQSKNIQLEKQWEYLDNAPIKRTFNEYFHFGGLPELVIREESFKRQWLGNLYNKIYFGDLISRYNIRNTTGLKVLVRK